MPKVDSKGRVVLPQGLRERLGITPGTEVEIREEEGKAVVKPEDDPDRVIERMNRLVAEASPEREQTTPIDDVDPIATNHLDAVRRAGSSKTERSR